MIVVKILNCRHQNRSNQNTTFVIYRDKYKPLRDFDVDENWVMENFNNVKPKDVELQKNTTIKIDR